MSPRAPRPSPRRAVDALTLIELLAVVAVVGILVALLLPALARSRASARGVTCVGNLRQLGLAVQMYWDENDGAAFRYRFGATNGGDLFWFGWIGRGAEGERAFDPSAGALHPYIGKRTVELCPALDYAMAGFKLKAAGAAYGYGYNLHLSAPLGQPPVNIARVSRTSDLGVLADAAQVNTFQPPASPERPMLEEFYYVSTNEATAHFRHVGPAANVFCADGHVGREKPVPGSLDARLPRAAVGRLRPDLLAVP